MLYPRGQLYCYQIYQNCFLISQLDEWWNWPWMWRTQDPHSATNRGTKSARPITVFHENTDSSCPRAPQLSIILDLPEHSNWCLLFWCKINSRNFSQVSALLGRIPSAVGYQPTLATDMGTMQERITTTKSGSITSVQVLIFYLFIYLISTAKNTNHNKFKNLNVSINNCWLPLVSNFTILQTVNQLFSRHHQTN